MNKQTLLIDGDWLCYKAAIAVEEVTQWSEDQWTLTSDAARAMVLVNDWIGDWCLTLHGVSYPDRNCLVTFSDPSGRYFRHDIFPEYKGNRKGKRKPVCYAALRDKIQRSYGSSVEPNLEADDLMGIYATNGDFCSPIIVTIDKDLDTVPGRHYNPDKEVLYDVSIRDAKRNHMFQTLVGDSTDGFGGCPGYGPVKANKLLTIPEYFEVPMSAPAWWIDVWLAFKDAGTSKDEANVQAQLAYILQADDYDFETGEVKLKTWM